MPNTKVIDLTSENSIPQDLKAARHAGVVGMVHQATIGDDEVDDKAKARVYLAKEAGMLVGLYHCLTDAKVRDQVKHFVDTAKELGLEDNWLLAVSYDTDDVDLSDVDEFLDELEKETRREPVLMAGPALKANTKTSSKKLANKRLWLKQYDSATVLPAGWDKYWLWQYTDAGKVEGVEGEVGCSDFIGSDQVLAHDWSGFKGKTDKSMPDAPAQPETAPSNPGEPVSGTAPAEQPAAGQQPAASEGTPENPSEPGEPESGTAPAEPAATQH